MGKEELLFYDAYESFYAMAKESDVFKLFCKDAFGEDFSQDGFSDIKQINRILEYIPKKDDVHVLDIGCGNGKMVKYLQSKTGCHIHGFDYSDNAIKAANAEYANFESDKADFRVGVMNEIDYDENSFDVITSMDSMYFAKDMNEFVKQIYSWLKPNGTFFVGYQEGDVMPKTENENTTVLAEAFRKNKISYEVTDITLETYEMMKKKRESAMKFEKQFLDEGLEEWYNLLIFQTDCIEVPFEEYKKENARYIYVVKA